MPDFIPGEYLPEPDAFPAAIAAVPTASPAFIGISRRRPRPVAGFHRVGSLAEYQRLFGATRPRRTLERGYLADSIALFFANGGTAAWVHSVGTGLRAPTAAAYLAALTTLAREPAPTLLLFPDAVRLGPAGLASVQRAALAHCAQIGDRFCILDLPAADSILRGGLPDFRARLGPDHLECGAVYGPWLRLPSPPAPAPAAPTRDLPASGAVAGIYATVDAQQGVWKAPANVAITGILELTETLRDQDTDLLAGDPATGQSINPMRNLPGHGIVVWGARTLAASGSSWRYVPVRRLVSMVERSVRAGTAYVALEPNTAATWLTLRTLVESFLFKLWQQGALAGAKPEQAYFVKAGLGTTMTAADLLQGRLHLTLGLAPLRPAEFLLLTITYQLPTA